MKANYFIIPIITLVVAVGGSVLTSAGVDGWYKTIRLPAWTPPGSVIGTVWTVIFILTAIAALLVWNSPGAKPRFGVIAAVFLLNAALNVIWSLLFFRLHLMFAAGWEAILLDLTIIALIVLCWPISRLSAVLLLPYAGWVAFAAYLTFTVWSLNK